MHGDAVKPSEITSPEQERIRARDQVLLERARRDPEALGEIYDIYASRIYAFLLKRCGHKELAEDLVSRVFIKFIEALPRFEWRGISLGAWLFRAASHALIDQWRSAQMRLDAELDLETDLHAPEDRPEETVDLSFEKDKVLQVMKYLSPRDQQVLDLRFFADLENQEIAAALNLSANHASVLVYRAIQRLRKRYLATFSSVSPSSSP